jgi:hypothetical protein
VIFIVKEQDGKKKYITFITYIYIYGTCWITNEIENKKIFKGGLIPEGWRLGRKINNGGIV